MYLLIVSLPFMGALTTLSTGRWIGREGSCILTTGCLRLSFFLSCIAFYEVGLAGRPIAFRGAPWIESEMFDVSWGFLFDRLTVTMLVVVTSISRLVHLYSTEYMGGDPHLPRFMAYLSIFTGFMLVLVTADNYIQMFLGWEGIGLASYLLINFWYTRLQANKAAIQAMLVNRVGDFGLALGIFAIFYQFHSVEYATVFATAPALATSTLDLPFLGNVFSGVSVLDLTCCLLFVGAVGKSAQLGLHVWLPMAMEGPTPVSALIHAATLVTAGLFLICRSSPLFEMAPTALVVVTVFGAMTAFFAASTGLVQNDLKRVIAYSTCSQLGYMTFACGLSNYNVGMFHVANHAFFKALLFLRAGAVIHAMNDEQDMRKMGGLVRILPFTYAMMFIGSLSLMGFPFMTGFYSKDVILELAYASCTVHGHFAHWLGTMAAFFTAFYSFRLLYLTFLDETNAHKRVMNHAHESPFAMRFPLFVLSFGAIFVGYLAKDLAIGLGTDFWGSSLYTAPEHSIIIDSEFIPHYIKLTPVIFRIIGATLSFLMYKDRGLWSFGFKPTPFGNNQASKGSLSDTVASFVVPVYTFLNRKWFFDKFYNECINQPIMSIGHHKTYKVLDRGVFEVFGPFGISNVLYKRSQKIVSMQTGLIYHYAFLMLMGLTFFVLVVGLADQWVSLADPRIFFTIVLCLFASMAIKKD